MKLVKKVLCVLLMSMILLTDLIGSLFAGGTAPDRRIAARHVFIEQTEANKGMERYASECYKLLGLGERMYIKSLEDCSYVSRPILENTIPAEADGLINPNDPIKLYAFKDKVSFGFSVNGANDWDDDFLIRVFDSSGKLVGSLSGSEVSDFHDEKGVDVYPSSKAENYYVEFSYDQALRTRLYGRLNMTPGAAFGLGFGIPLPGIPSPRITIPTGGSKSTKSSSSSSSSRKASKSKAEAEKRMYCYVLFSVSTFEPDLLPEEVKEVESVMQKYMKERNISSYSELDEYDLNGMIVDELRGYFMERWVNFFNVEDYRRTLSTMSLSEIDKRSMKYLTKHRISSINDMTDAQVIALWASMFEGGFDGDPEYLRLIKDYKNKHGIKSYDNMTLNELNRMQRVVGGQSRTLSEKYMKQYMQKGSSSSAKKSSSTTKKASSTTKKKKSR